MAHDPKDHVMDTHSPGVGDSHHWDFFTDLFDTAWSIPLPVIGDFEVSKFMILELIGAGILVAIFVPLAKKAKDGSLPKGAWWNAFESLLTFVRNDIAKPNLEAHEHHEEHHEDHGEPPKEEPPTEHADNHHPPSQADKYVPFLWTLFLFILVLNLLGMIPFMGSATASIWVTGSLALCSFVMMHGAAIAKMGPISYLKAMWPKIEIDIPYIGSFLGAMFSLLIFVIEMFGTVIKSGVLAVRLFANMFAGHLVLAMILFFIFEVGSIHLQAGNEWSVLWWVVTVASVVGAVLLSMLELFVAFLQAYVFTFLTALFMGMSLNPEH